MITFCCSLSIITSSSCSFIFTFSVQLFQSYMFLSLYLYKHNTLKSFQFMRFALMVQFFPKARQFQQHRFIFCCFYIKHNTLKSLQFLPFCIISRALPQWLHIFSKSSAISVLFRILTYILIHFCSLHSSFIVVLLQAGFFLV